MTAERWTGGDWLRYEGGLDWLGRTYTTDNDGRYRCEDCDALLMCKRHKCDRCKAIAKANRRARRQTGRHRDRGAA